MGTDNLFHKKKAQKARQKRLPQHILIVTEGETEKIYLSGLKDEYKLTNVVMHQCTTGSDATNIYKQACDKASAAYEGGIDFTHVFCVFDLDTAKTTGAFNVLNDIYSAKHKFIEQIHAIVSYPCIELWFYLHFEYSSACFSASGNKTVGDVAKSKLNHLWEQHFKTKYSETQKNTYSTLKNHSTTAHDNAKKLLTEQQKINSNNPITNFHELVAFLESGLKTEFEFTRIRQTQ